MIEFCSEKRMFLAIGILGGITILVLVIESHWTATAGGVLHPTPVPVSNSSCWLREDFDVVEECHPCSDFELTSKSIKECIPTKFKEVLLCKASGKVFRSCAKVVWLEERKFWLFQGTTFSFAILSSGLVLIRQRQLDRQMLRRLQNQLASCA